MSVKNLNVYTKTEELLYKIYPVLIKYPKSERYALCQTIKLEFFELLKFISLANSVKSKRVTYLQEADGHLQTLKILIDLSKKRRYISTGFHRVARGELEEVNRLLSGYIRSTRK
jgi:hypothetical protein